MKILLILLGTLKILCASDFDDQQPDVTNCNSSKYPPVIMHPGKFYIPADCMPTEYAFLLPMDENLARKTLSAYRNPRNMRLGTGEIVRNPFDSIPYISTWCFLSHEGVFGHIKLDLSRNGVAAITIIGNTEVVNCAFLIHEGLNQLINSNLFRDREWFIQVFNGNASLRNTLETCEFTLTSPPQSIIAKYARSSNANKGKITWFSFGPKPGIRVINTKSL